MQRARFREEPMLTPPGLPSASPAPLRSTLAAPLSPPELSALLQRFNDFGDELDASFQDRIPVAESSGSSPDRQLTPAPSLPLATPGSWRGDWIVTPHPPGPPPGLVAPNAPAAPPGLAPPTPPGFASSRVQHELMVAHSQVDDRQKDESWARQDLAEAEAAAQEATRECALAVARAQTKEREMLLGQKGWIKPPPPTTDHTTTDARQLLAKFERERAEVEVTHARELKVTLASQRIQLAAEADLAQERAVRAAVAGAIALTGSVVIGNPEAADARAREAVIRLTSQRIQLAAKADLARERAMRALADSAARTPRSVASVDDGIAVANADLAQERAMHTAKAAARTPLSVAPGHNAIVSSQHRIAPPVKGAGGYTYTLPTLVLASSFPTESGVVRLVSQFVLPLHFVRILSNTLT